MDDLLGFLSAIPDFAIICRTDRRCLLLSDCCEKRFQKWNGNGRDFPVPLLCWYRLCEHQPASIYRVELHRSEFLRTKLTRYLHSGHRRVLLVQRLHIIRNDVDVPRWRSRRTESPGAPRTQAAVAGISRSHHAKRSRSPVDSIEIRIRGLLPSNSAAIRRSTASTGLGKRRTL
jgi:hypothetical protein